MPRTPERAVVSFTFDDFPRSAADNGADVLSTVGAVGTFYAASAMVGSETVMGEMFSTDDLQALIKAGHEIGTHTHSHCDCAVQSTATVRKEIKTNLTALEEMGCHTPAAHFAWPYGETRAAHKQHMDDLAATARGILPGINRKGSDLMQLRSYTLTPDSASTAKAIKAIDAAARQGGWVTLFTHDVRRAPSAFGTTPSELRKLVKVAQDAGAAILSVSAAHAYIQSGALAP
ncbi:MAG: polysaccharide deacetylase family protein [Pseudomonadota bacterium]